LVEISEKDIAWRAVNLTMATGNTRRKDQNKKKKKRETKREWV